MNHESAKMDAYYKEAEEQLELRPPQLVKLGSLSGLELKVYTFSTASSTQVSTC